MLKHLENLRQWLKGELKTDSISRILYSTDASAYREEPLAVFIPCEDYENDIRLLLQFCKDHNTFIIPRAAGTSLAGQVVGKGIVVDVSKNLNKIIEINEKEHWVRVQPGVVLEELNRSLKPYGLFFGPETSTANRCCIGGMVGNNSCGLHSLVYGSVREHLLEAEVILADGNKVLLKQLSKEEFENKTLQNDLEGKIYKYIASVYSKQEIRQLVADAVPDKEVTRRNNGYALDFLCDSDYPNLAKLYCGSEGTLAFATELKLNLVPLPPKHKALLCVHFSRLQDSFTGNLIALRHNPMAVELMDNNIIEAAYRNPAQRNNTFFIKDKPQAILIIEFAFDSEESLDACLNETIEDFKSEGTAYDFSIVKGEDISKVWGVRKAGLGLLTNIPGSKKPVSVIEDTAVNPQKLPSYLEEFQTILDKYKLKCVYHAHIATGELHLRPVLDLKDSSDVVLFRKISNDIALLVKKYGGSLSGEHGDGRLRGEWIPLMYGEQIYDLMKQMKNLWDENGVFNIGKIVETPPMDKFLRYENASQRQIKTYFSFNKELGLQNAAEQCNGAADCRKSQVIGGLMCPTFKQSKEEADTPRARANIIRELLSFSQEKDPLQSELIKAVLDNCLMCKACKNECPSNVDISKLKSEALQHYYDANGYNVSTLLVSYLPRLQAMASIAPFLYNWVVSCGFTSKILKNILGFAPERTLPKIHNCNFEKEIKQHSQKSFKKTIYLFIDEFSRYQDTEIAKTTIKLFSVLGYKVKKAPIKDSGRTAISKGMLKRAKQIANKNIKTLLPLIDETTPLVGIEPSATLSFRDEYPDLVNSDIRKLTQNTYLFDEFFAKEIENGNIDSSYFTKEPQHIILHGHCQQKALIGTKFMERMLSLPKNYSVDVIPSGCCGMAGSYGYERKHYDMSKKIAHSVLIPAIEKADYDTIIAAPGTSCREQISHFSKRKALHPIEVLYNAIANIK